ncbi:flagellar basal body L-ring protein FlgH [Marilutibacter alkalisoli]|uniref:Flagellar basal body L-ring protein FlgH n=1 Tax=Marilutibacter alkalisoli TaxID=2591633 RepID=A0A514BRZ5_9GAMM|nr:flagellar basal body L-ring protein FlgH [Lysobacter alkalisoli]QDH70153.1 flagellar basal body L-ring protein FlgH [Lysobacter alkalisoli]
MVSAFQSEESLIDPASYRNLAADHRAYRVGDVVSVYVLETTRAKSQAATDAASGLDVRVGLDSPSTRYNARLGMGASNTGGAQTTRLGEVRAQIASRVIEVEPDGRMWIEGEQVLRINGERQQIRLRGVIRPEDIAADNTVLSHRIADADIELTGVGVVSESTRQSLVYRLFKWLRLM